MISKGKNAIVTGASGGMGQLLCRKFAEQGVNLAICSIDEEALEKQAAELTAEYGISVIAKKVDATKECEVKDFIGAAADTLGKIDYLINLAGLSIPNVYNETPVDVYEKVMDVNVKGAFLMSKHFAANAAETALIINIGSKAARVTNANAPIYCMAKAAVNKLSEGLLLQYGKMGIRVTTINPSGADTPFWGTRSVDRSKLMSAAEVVDVIWAVINMPDNVQVNCVDFESFSRFI